MPQEISKDRKLSITIGIAVGVLVTVFGWGVAFSDDRNRTALNETRSKDNEISIEQLKTQNHKVELELVKIRTILNRIDEKLAN